MGAFAAIEAGNGLGTIGVVHTPLGVRMAGPGEVDVLAEEDVAGPESLGAGKVLDHAERSPPRRHRTCPQAVLCQAADLAERHVLKEVEEAEQQRDGLADIGGRLSGSGHSRG